MRLRPRPAPGHLPGDAPAPLLDARPGTRLEVLAVDLLPSPRRRLAELGVRPGVTVGVLSRSSGGGRVVAVGLGHLALDRGTAAHITVRAAQEGS